MHRIVAWQIARNALCMSGAVYGTAALSKTARR
jgi:hypothetical protein